MKGTGIGKAFGSWYQYPGYIIGLYPGITQRSSLIQALEQDRSLN